MSPYNALEKFALRLRSEAEQLHGCSIGFEPRKACSCTFGVLACEAWDLAQRAKGETQWPLGIPAWVLRDRAALSPMQALAYYLCEYPHGPRLTHSEAARHLGIRGDSAGGQVATHLNRARSQLGVLPW